MSPHDCNERVLTPALALLPAYMDSKPARRMLLAIGLQESELKFRRQIGGGPGRGLWQFEQGGGTLGVLSHRATFAHAAYVCDRYGIDHSAAAVQAELDSNDTLAAAFARLLLFTHPRSLPETPEAGWAQYVAIWRPGRPRIKTWKGNWDMATEGVGGG